MKILVYRIGFVGDLLVSLPCFHLLRERYPQAQVTLLTEVRAGSKYVPAQDIIGGAGLIDDIMTYQADAPKRWKEYLRLWRDIRRRRFDLLLYLAPSGRPRASIRRDVLFYRSAGIKRIDGADREALLPPQDAPKPLHSTLHEADLLLHYLENSGWTTPSPGAANMSMNLGEKEKRAVDAWMSSQANSGGRRLVGFGMGSKRLCNMWPFERYGEVARRLVEDFDIWPVMFGSGEDAEPGRAIVERLGRGWVPAGDLSVRESAEALSRCALFVGNNSGVIHMAACAGAPCVGVYSAREYPGNWSPYGPGHRALRETVPCEGCMLDICVANGMECMMRIGVDAVLEACRSVLDKGAA